MSVTFLFERWKHKSGYTRSHFGVLHSQTKLVPIDLGLRIATITTWCTDDSNDNIAQEYLQPSEMVSETPKSTFKGDHGTNTTEGTIIVGICLIITQPISRTAEL